MRALVHAVGDRLGECELTYVPRQRIDVARARAQHVAYCLALRACGVDVRVLDVSPDHPDATFVEDAAVVLDEVAIATSMGTEARRGEVDNLLPVLAELRPVQRLHPPATLEGGDVLRLGRTLWVGLSPRTNRAGIAAFAALVAPYGYQVLPVEVRGCLHLKTACTAIDESTLLANRAWLGDLPLAGHRCLDVAEGEPFAANLLRAGKVLVASASHPRTLARIAAGGHEVRTVELDELEKAEAGATCLSILLA